MIDQASLQQGADVSALTEQEQAEFSQAAEKVRSVGIAVIAQSEYAEKAIQFYEHVHFNLDQVVAVAFESTPKAVCKAGCDFCCKNRSIEVTLPEALFIAEQIKKLPEADQAELVARLRKTVAAIQNNQQPEACTFLNDSQCMIYHMRPSVCRKAHSQSVKACEENDPIPQHLGALIGAEAMMQGTQQAFAALGYQAEVQELSVAVYAALTNQNLLTEWYKAYLDAQRVAQSKHTTNLD